MMGGMTRLIPFLTDPEDTLLTAPSVRVFLERCDKMQQLTGLPLEDFVASMMCSIPLPRYTRRDSDELRFVGLDVEALRCPIFWLPDEVGLRQYVTDDGKERRVESDDEWALRVAVHLVTCGLYDPEKGLWVDLPEALGHDLDDQQVKARFSAWIGGRPDGELDELDASPLFAMPTVDGDPVEYSYLVAQGSFDQMQSMMLDSHYQEVLSYIASAGAEWQAGDYEDEKELREDLLLAVKFGQMVTRCLGDSDVRDVLQEAEDNLKVSESGEEMFGFALSEAVEVLAELKKANQAKADAAFAQTDETLQMISSEMEAELEAAAGQDSEED